MKKDSEAFMTSDIIGIDNFMKYIEISRVAQKKAVSMGLNSQEILRDYCTIRFQGIRRSGHTTLAKQLMEKMNFIYVAMSKDIGRKTGIIPYITVNTPIQLRGQNCDGIIVDPASKVSKRKLTSLYDVLGYDCKKPMFVILLG